MKLKQYIYLLILMITLAACNNQRSEEPVNNDYMLFSSKIDTKVNHDVFTTTDQIGLYIVERVTPELPNNNLENMLNAVEKNLLCYRANDGYLTMPKFIDYPRKNIDAHAYYPHNITEATGDNQSIRNITIKANQQNQDDYFISDFKKATVINWTKPNPKDPKEKRAIPLEFIHQLSKISITLKSSTKTVDELLDLIKKVKFKNVALNGTFDMMTNKAAGDFTNYTNNSIIPFGTLTKDNNTLKGLEAIIMPCEADQAPIFAIEANDGLTDYTLKFKERLIQGKEYNYTIDVNDGGKISYTVTLQPWNPSSSSGNMDLIQ